METSFKPVDIEKIPQNTEGANPDTSYSYEKRVDESESSPLHKILIFITVIIFLIAVGLFAWGEVLKTQIDNGVAQLNLKETQLSSASFSDITKISTKIHVVKNLIGSHPFFSSALDVLQYSVQKGVIYNKFDAHVDGSTGDYFVDVSGTAPDYHTLIQQVDILKTDPTYTKYFLSTDATSFKPNAKGAIDFSLKIKLNIKGAVPLDVMGDLSKGKEAYLESLSPGLENNNVTTQEDETTSSALTAPSAASNKNTKTKNTDNSGPSSMPTPAEVPAEAPAEPSQENIPSGFY